MIKRCIIIKEMKSPVQIAFGCLVAVSIFALLGGCDNSEVSRTVKPAEIQESNTRRAAEIDKLNIPQAQKDQMKAHLGGNSAAPANTGQPGGPEGR